MVTFEAANIAFFILITIFWIMDRIYRNNNNVLHRCPCVWHVSAKIQKQIFFGELFPKDDWKVV